MVPGHKDEVVQPNTDEQLRALCVSMHGLTIELVARAKVGDHATAGGKKMAATSHMLSCRGKIVLPPAKKKGPSVVDSQKEDAVALHTSRCGGSELVADRRGRATVDSKKKGCCRAPHVLARGKKGDNVLTVGEVFVV